MAEYVCEISYEGKGGNHGTFERKERVVRCRDCKEFQHKAFGNPTRGYFRCWDYCNRWAEDVDPDGFCAWGFPMEES